MADKPPLIEVLKNERQVSSLMIPVHEAERDRYLALADEQHVHFLVSSYEHHYRSVYMRGLVNWLDDLIAEYDV